MKHQFIFATVLLFFFVNSYSQSSEKKLKFRSISAGFGICAGEINDGGINGYLDVTTAYDKNLFSFAYSTGAEFELFDASRNYTEIAALYGREINLSRIIKIESYIGLAYFNVNYKNDDTNFNSKSESAIGIPLKVKLLFYVSKNFALGLNPNITFNSIENIYSANFILQYKF